MPWPMKSCILADFSTTLPTFKELFTYNSRSLCFIMVSKPIPFIVYDLPWFNFPKCKKQKKIPSAGPWLSSLFINSLRICSSVFPNTGVGLTGLQLQGFSLWPFLQRATMFASPQVPSISHPVKILKSQQKPRQSVPLPHIHTEINPILS